LAFRHVVLRTDYSGGIVRVFVVATVSGTASYTGGRVRSGLTRSALARFADEADRVVEQSRDARGC
jgi:hypothetical protein